MFGQYTVGRFTCQNGQPKELDRDGARCALNDLGWYECGGSIEMLYRVPAEYTMF